MENGDGECVYEEDREEKKEREVERGKRKREGKRERRKSTIVACWWCEGDWGHQWKEVSTGEGMGDRTLYD